MFWSYNNIENVGQKKKMNLIISSVLVASFIHYVAAYSPVIIVPGTGGSQLEAKLDGKPSKPAFYCSSKTNSYFTLWLDIKSLFPFSINCWVDNVRLEWDLKSMTVKNSPGVLTRTRDFGETSSIESLDDSGYVKYMKPLVDYLTTLGYIRGKDIRGAPYDFRYSPENIPSDYHNRLKQLIEETYTSNGNTKATIISHSYGCPVTLYFLSIQTKQWKSKYLKQWIPLSGVFGGTKQELLLYSSGYLESIPKILVNSLTIRGEQRSSTSNLFMLPSAHLWPKDDVIVFTNKRSYKLSDMDAFLSDIGFSEGAVMRKNILNSTSLMETSPGVPIYCFYGNKPSSTINQLVFDDDFPDKPKDLILGPGDGTVNLESLELCKNFEKQQHESVQVTEIPGVKHNDVLQNDIVFSKLKEIL